MTKKRKLLTTIITFCIFIAGFFTLYFYIKEKPASNEHHANNKTSSPATTMNSDGYYDEPFRPQFHYSPEANWMNDPNGMVYYKGKYHLFYQYYPYGTQWGPMHWGHATSKDLVHWEHLPVALAPDSNGQIFSGSIVVDYDNTSGFGVENNPPLVAIYTQNNNGQQNQSIAYSIDEGNTWTKYEGNPIMKDFPKPDWRDPKVFWHEETNSWIMPLAAKDQIMFYTSPNLKDWEFASEFKPQNATDQTLFECPEIFPLPVDGNKNNQKWVLATSLGDGAIAGGSGMEYYIGSFDGKKFTPDTPDAYWLDYGPDFYAGVTWENAPNNDEYRTMIAWMSNWKYANNTPTSTWRSANTIPRKLELKTVDNGEIKLIQTPVSQLENLRHNSKSYKQQTISENNNLLSNISSDTLELVADFKVDNTTSASTFGFKVRKGNSQFTTIGYDKNKKTIYVDRTNSGDSGFYDQFAKLHEAPLATTNGHIKMHIFIDRSSVELFANDGQVTITDQIFPDPSSNSIELFANDGEVTLDSLQVYSLNDIWGKSPLHSDITDWHNINGLWADTYAGKQGSDMEDAFTLGKQMSKDFHYEANIKIGNQGAGGLVFRSDDNADNAYIANLDLNGQLVKLWKRESGQAIILATVPYKIDPETIYHMKIEAHDNQIKLSINNELLLTEQDDSFTEGKLGLNVWNGTSSFQNVKLKNID
ncbi:GH32 C-terminal domain-containing protein [Niallia sp. 01092]|uniref:GH32 C-terminal domain-containing protein n=1 Tax=unclassified Niallia TaxID=2837522 RepID=UPI003FD64BF6